MTSEQISLNVSRETLDKLSIYVDELLKWNQKINLIGRSTEKEIWTRHIEDSLQLTSWIKDKSQKILDIGTGAGFPGLVLNIAGHKNITLIDADFKKILFLEHVKRLLHLEIKILNERIENHLELGYDIITARAFTALKDLLSLGKIFLRLGGVCFFYKGENYQKEVEEAKKAWDFRIEIYPSVTHSKSVILKIEDIRKR